MHFSAAKKHGLCPPHACTLPTWPAPLHSATWPWGLQSESKTPGVPGTKQVGLASCWELNEGRAALLTQHWDVYQNLLPSESTWQDAQRTAALPWVLRLPCFLQAWKMNNNPG